MERLGQETAAFHDIADEEVSRMLGAVTPDDYRQYLIQMYGFICPLERAIAKTPQIELYLEPARFQKRELLRRDLSALHMTADQIGALRLCAVPAFRTPQEAIGWAYPIERSTLRHGDLFRHLASLLPGELAFASAYLKCYSSAVGQSWNAFERTLETCADEPRRAQQVIDAANAAFQCLRAWRFLHRDDRRRSASHAISAVARLAATQRTS